jgi:hypothetical protein
MVVFGLVDLHQKRHQKGRYSLKNANGPNRLCLSNVDNNTLNFGQGSSNGAGNIGGMCDSVGHVQNE